METPDKKELITEMVSLLKAYEEPYEEGAWENFNGVSKSKKGTYLLWIGIAALFAVILSAMPFIFDSNPAQNTVVVKNKPQVNTTPSTPAEDVIHVPDLRRSESGKMKRVAKSASSKSVVADQLLAIVPVTPVKEATIAVVKESQQPVDQQVPVEPSVKPLAEPLHKKTFSEFLEGETKVAKSPQVDKSSKWNFGVELSPTMLQSKVNMGAGITTEYKLSDKFSLSSGISYVALNAGQKFADPQPVSLMSSKKLVSMEANIRAIDIPVSLTFNVNKRMYTAIGVSYFNVLSERRNNNYLTQLEVSKSALNSSTGQIESYQTQVSQQNSEVTQDIPLDGNSYLGFINFSIGHKQTISKNHQIIIEPFLKVPVGKLSTEDLKLGNGGVKLRYAF